MADTSMKNAITRSVSLSEIIRGAEVDTAYNILTFDGNKYYKVIIKDNNFLITVEVLNKKIISVFIDKINENIKDDLSIKIKIIDSDLIIVGITGQIDISVDYYESFVLNAAILNTEDETTSISFADTDIFSPGIKKFCTDVDINNAKIKSATADKIETREIHANTIRIGDWSFEVKDNSSTEMKFKFNKN